MKKSKRRLILSLLTVFMMVFTVIPYMGTGNVSAAAGDTVTFTFTPTLNNPISKVVLTQQANGNYRVQAAAKCTLYDSYEANGKAVTVSFFDADRAEAGQTSLLAGYGVSQNVDDHLYNIAGTGAWTEIEPGQTVRLSACAYYNYYYENGVGAPVWYDDTKGYKAKSQYAVKFTAPCDTHSWKDATCTAAKKCSKCGTTSGSALGHTYTNACDTSCNRSGCTYTRTTTHNYSNGACTVCGAADPSAKVEEAKDKTLGTYTVKKGDYTTKEYLVGQLYLDKTVNTLNFYNYKGTLVLRDSNGNQVVSGKSMFDNDDIDQYITKAGMYKVYAETYSTSPSQDYTYDVTYTLTKDIVYTYKFASLSARQSDTGRVFLNIGTYDGPSTNLNDINQAMYRVSNGKIRQVSWNDAHGYTDIEDDGNIEYATAYTYYVVNLDKLSAANKNTLSAVDSSSVDLTPAHQTALADPYVTKSNTVETEDIEIAEVNNLRNVNTKEFDSYRGHPLKIKAAELEWGWTNGACDGFIVQSFNKDGVLIDEREYQDGRFSQNYITIPYKGESTVKVFAYYDKDGTRMPGKPAEITVTSPEIVKPAHNVTKISTNKVKITVRKTEGADYVKVFKKVSGKWKQIGVKSTKETYKLTHSAKNAGKANYKIVAYVTENGQEVGSKYVTGYAKANTCSFTKYTAKYMRTTYGLDTYWKPTNVKYNSKGKLVVTGRAINAWSIVGGKYKVKVSVYCDGKLIGYKTINGSIAKLSYQTKTFTCSGSKSGADLRYGQVTFKLKWYKKI